MARDESPIAFSRIVLALPPGGKNKIKVGRRVPRAPRRGFRASAKRSHRIAALVGAEQIDVEHCCGFVCLLQAVRPVEVTLADPIRDHRIHMISCSFFFAAVNTPPPVVGGGGRFPALTSSALILQFSSSLGLFCRPVLPVKNFTLFPACGERVFTGDLFPIGRHTSRRVAAREAPLSLLVGGCRARGLHARRASSTSRSSSRARRATRELRSSAARAVLPSG